MKSIRIANRMIGQDHPPLIIAEMSANHGQDLDKALKLVDAAAAAGAHALKLQTYTADTMTLDIGEGEFYIDDSKSLWKGHSLYELYRKAYTPWEWHPVIFEHARKLGLLAFSTPFDATAVDFLESLDVPCYKIASFENGDLDLIRRVASTGKPLIISTGTATLSEIHEAVDTARAAGAKELILLKCTSAYPADPRDINLAVIPDMATRFECQVGLSDHTTGTAVAVASVTMGARVIEKHFTLDRRDQDIDSAFSIEPAELESLAEDTHVAWQAIGQASYELSKGDARARKQRRSLYVVKELKKGQIVTDVDVRAIRPGGGLAPKHLSEVIGRKARLDTKVGTALNWEILE